MSLSVSSFPEAPTTLVQQQPKCQVTSSLKSSGRFLGTLGKRSVPFLKGVGHFAKTRVKGSITRQRANVLRSRSLFKLHSSFTRSPNRPSSIVIDITPTSNFNKFFSATSSDADASSLNPTIEISFSRTISRTPLSTPTTVKGIHVLPATDPVKAPFQYSVQSLVGDNAHTYDETAVQHPAKEHEEVASDSGPHDLQPSDSEIATSLPIPPSPTTQSPTVPVISIEGRRRSHSASAGVKVSTTKTVLKTLTRYKSETAIGLSRRLTNMTRSDDPSPSQGKDPSIGENQIPPPPALGNAQASMSTSMNKQHQQKHARARSGASSKSTGGSKAVESPPPSVPSTGSHLSANSRRPSTASFPQAFSSSTTALVPKLSPEQMDLLQAPPSPHLRPKTSDVAAASPQTRSRSLLLLEEGSGPSEDADSELLPLPSSVDRGLWLRLAAVPHES